MQGLAHRNAVRRAAAMLVGGLLLLSTASAAVKISGRAYDDLPDFGRRFGLAVTWTKPGRELRLHSRWTKLEFTTGSREIAWNGRRIFLGEPVLPRRGGLWLATSDLDATLVPLLKPDAAPPPGELKLIALDAGHGGTDPGTENRRLKLREKDLTLDVAKRLKPLLEARGYRVLLVRDRDMRFSTSPSVDLPKRADVANQAGADLYISIHFNALPGDSRVQGIETYAFTPAGQRSTASSLHRASDRTAHPVNRHDHWNMVLAAAVHTRMVEELAAADRGLKRARWAMLRELRCPGILVEAGFVSNETEGRKIGTPGYRQRIAESIAGGVEDYAGRLRAAQSGRS